MEVSNEIPVGVFASGWIPFVIVLFLCLVFAIGYIFWYRSENSSEMSKSATAVSIFALTVTLVTSILVPVDVFLVSFMKNPNGTYKSWAESEENRDHIENSVLNAYYVFYGLILTLAFLVLPLAFFYHACATENAEGDEDLGQQETTGQRCWRALKYTSICALIFAILIVIGIFVPFGEVQPPHHNGTAWQRLKFTFEKINVVHGQNLVRILTCSIVCEIFY